jgi:hypothetical protein
MKLNKDRKKKSVQNSPFYLTITSVSHGLASTFEVSCNHAMTDKRKRKHMVIIEPKERATSIDMLSKLCQYDINIRYCLALQQQPWLHFWTYLIHISGRDNSQHWRTSFTQKLTSVQCKLQGLATEEEVASTINSPDNIVEQSLLNYDVPHYWVRESFDMGWQVRSSKGKYASPTGHALLIGAISKKMMDSVVFNKQCGLCTKHIVCTGTSDGVRKHCCIKHYEGSSKSMEAAALTKMLMRRPDEKVVSTCAIILDDDSNGRAKSRHIENGGELPNNAEEPTFYASPSHRQ